MRKHLVRPSRLAAEPRRVLATLGLAVGCLALFPLPQTALAAALAVTDSVDSRGWYFTTDSFQSTNLPLFPGGVWNSANRMDHGDISTLSTNSSALSLQNCQIRGSLHTPPNWTATGANIGSGDSVGDNAFVGGGFTGIEPGHAINNTGQVYADASLPSGTIFLPASATSWYNPADGITYKYVLTANHPWWINNLNGSIYVKGTSVLLELTGTSATVPSGGAITVPNLTDVNGNPNRLTMYVAATSFTVNGTGFVNASGIARNLQYYGLPSNTSVTLGGNGTFTTLIYAPEADFSLGGGGNNTYDFSGAIITKSFTLNGHFNLHYDESLDLGPIRIPISIGLVLSLPEFINSNQVQFFVTGVTGFNYAVEASTNLSDWASLTTNVSPFIFVDIDAGNFAQRFYRAVYLP